MALSENPKGSTVSTDEKGSYVAFHKVCNTCASELTSRNRPPSGNLLCKPCFAVRAKEGWKKPPDAIEGSQELDQPAPVKRTRTKQAGNPAWQKVQSALFEFLLSPRAKGTKDDLLAALVNYEIKDRFQFL